MGKFRKYFADVVKKSHFEKFGKYKKKSRNFHTIFLSVGILVENIQT